MSELRKEVARKIIHFTGISYIFAYTYLGKNFLLEILIYLFLIAIIIEVLRIKFGLLKNLFRSYESMRPAAYFFTGLAFLIITAFFPKDACFVAVSCAILGDGTAGILRRLNYERYASVAMFFSSLAILPLVEPTPCIISAFSSTLVERAKVFEDNLTVPITAAVTYSLVNYLFS